MVVETINTNKIVLWVSKRSVRRRRNSRLRRIVVVVVASSSSSSVRVLMRHLETATAENETLNAKVRVGRDEDHPERGLTLLANRPLRAEEVVVSLPRKARVMRAVSDDDEEDIYSWSKALAKQLEFDESERKKHGMWLQSLPKEAPKVPGIYMGIEDIERWVKDVQLRERLIRSRKDHCAFVKEMNNNEKDNKRDLSRMRSFLQSRMFTDGKQRWNAPLIDFCNHEEEANCFVRTNVGKENKQGKTATAEIRDDDGVKVGTEEEFFELVVSDEGPIDVDEPLTITYASADNTSLFFEQYGFLLDGGDSTAFLNSVDSVEKFLAES